MNLKTSRKKVFLHPRGNTNYLSLEIYLDNWRDMCFNNGRTGTTFNVFYTRDDNSKQSNYFFYDIKTDRNETNSSAFCIINFYTVNEFT